MPLLTWTTIKQFFPNGFSHPDAVYVETGTQSWLLVTFRSLQNVTLKKSLQPQCIWSQSKFKMHFELMVEFNKNDAHTSLHPLQGAH